MVRPLLLWRGCRCCGATVWIGHCCSAASAAAAQIAACKWSLLSLSILRFTVLHCTALYCTSLQVLWGHCVDLLQRGFSSGSILTVDPEDARRLGKPWTRRSADWSMSQFVWFMWFMGVDGCGGMRKGGSNSRGWGNLGHAGQQGLCVCVSGVVVSTACREGCVK